MRKLQILMLTIFTTTAAAFGQRVMLDGYVFEESNRGFLNEVKVTVLEKTGVYVGETISDISGHFAIEIDGGKNYDVQFEKKIFKIEHTDLSTIGKTAGETVFLKQQMQRLPGYLLEVTLAEKRFNESVPVDAVNGEIGRAHV